MQYVYKSAPFAHQAELFELSAEREYFAFLMEQGTGKTKPTIDTAAYLYEEGEIRLFVVAAPNGVHVKWAIEDLPLSLPDRIPHRVMVWKSDGTKRTEAAYRRLLEEEGDHLRIFLVNTELLALPQGVERLAPLLRKYRALFAVDESIMIMTPGAKRTENVINLGAWAEYRRILNGTPVVKSPFDLYSQFNFLSPSILNEPSYFAFKSQYGVFYAPKHPFVVNIAAKNNPALARAVAAARAKGWPHNKGVELQLPPGAYQRMPRILETDAAGNPKYKNLERLKKLITPHSYRKTKAECFDLPPKIYQTRFFAMTKEQRRVYDELRDTSRAILEDETVIISHKLTVQLRLHQVACGYLPTGNEDEVIPLFRGEEHKNPRVIAVLHDLEEYEGQTVIWCRFKREVEVLKGLINDKYGPDTAVTYYGDTESLGGNKQANKMAFIEGRAKYLIGTAASGGVGHNFANSSKGIFNSNTFSYWHRSQAEDRQHRFGLADSVEHVLYVDIQAEDSVDQDIVASIRMKMDLADYMMDKKQSSPGAWLYE